MPTTTAGGTLAPTYRHHVLTRSMLTGGIGIGHRRIGRLHYQDGGNAGGGAGNGGDGKPNGEGNEGEGDGDDGETPTDVTGLKSALAKVREERKQARAEIKATRERLEALEKQQRDAEESKRKDAEEETKRKGEFEKLAADREKERDEAKAEVTTLTSEVDQLRKAMADGLKAGWSELPEAVRKLGEKQHPEEDVLGRWTFLHDPDTAALVKELAGDKEPARGNGGNPRNSGGSAPSVEQTRNEMRQIRGMRPRLVRSG